MEYEFIYSRERMIRSPIMETEIGVNRAEILKLFPYKLKSPHVFSHIELTEKLCSDGYDVVDAYTVFSTSGKSVFPNVDTVIVFNTTRDVMKFVLEYNGSILIVRRTNERNKNIF